jgi:hypothetical protein
MKLPTAGRGLTTAGLLGITLVVLASLEILSSWWLLIAVPLIISAIGIEGK